MKYKKVIIKDYYINPIYNNNNEIIKHEVFKPISDKFGYILYKGSYQECELFITNKQK